MSQWDKLLKRIPKHEHIKKVYVQMVKDVVESEASNHEDSE